MEKVYLKYNDETLYKKTVECDFGPAWPMVIIGAFYPLSKHDLKYFLLMIITQVSLCALFIIFIKDIIVIPICIGMVFLVNLLFALNYNMIIIEKLLKLGYVPMDYNTSDKLIKKGIYFKLQ